VHPLMILLGLALVGVPLWRIVKRTGLPPALSLLGLIPFVNIIFIWVFAFTDWPAVKQSPTA
jgi:hypothetical protein